MERDPNRDLERDQERESWGRTGELLDRIADDGVTVGRARLEEIAMAALAGAAARPARVRLLPRLAAKLAAAAGLLIAVSLGVHFALNRPAGKPDLLPLPPPACLADPEFVTNFELIRDLPELDADGDLLDIDDDVLMLQALEGA